MFMQIIHDAKLNITLMSFKVDLLKDFFMLHKPCVNIVFLGIVL